MKLYQVCLGDSDGDVFSRWATSKSGAASIRAEAKREGYSIIAKEVVHEFDANRIGILTLLNEVTG